MKTKVTKTMVIIATLMFCGLPQYAFSQDNKVKKVKYLGHKYEGQVNNDKIPDGDGVISIDGLLIKGKFNGMTISDAVVTKENSTILDACYYGTVIYNESNSITIKAGGKISINIVIADDSEVNSSWWVYKPGNEKLENIDLKEDRVVNLGNFDLEELTISYRSQDAFDRGGFEAKLKYMMSKIKNPLTLTFRYTLKPTMVNIQSDSQGTVKVKGFVDNPFKHSIKEGLKGELKGYKDKEGRIWDFSSNKEELKITYPNGSYYYDNGKINNFQINYSDGRQLFYNKEMGFSIDNITYLRPKDWKGASIFCKYINTFPRKFGLDTQYSKTFHVKNAGLGNDEIKNSVEKTINALIANAQTLSNVYIHDEKNTTLGEIRDGKFISQEVIDANRAAADAKAKKELQAKLAPFIKRFGFDPSEKSTSQLIKSGRSFKLLCDWYNHLAATKGKHAEFRLSIDHGSSKCYDVLWGVVFGDKIGYIWVNGDKVTTVVWY